MHQQNYTFTWTVIKTNFISFVFLMLFLFRRISGTWCFCIGRSRCRGWLPRVWRICSTRRFGMVFISRWAWVISRRLYIVHNTSRCFKSVPDSHSHSPSDTTIFLAVTLTSDFLSASRTLCTPILVTLCSSFWFMAQKGIKLSSSANWTFDFFD